MDFSHFTAGKDDSDRRLDRVLRNFLSEENLSSIYKSLRKGLVKVNGKKCEGNFRVSEGDDIQIANFLLPQNATSEEENQEKAGSSKKTGKQASSSIIIDSTVFKNDFILILNKPYDMSVQPSSPKGNSLSELVQKEYEESHQKTSLSFKTGPLHRLDRKTTGLIAFSQNLEGAKWFSQAIKTHAVQKIYLAILEGNLSEEQVWEDYIEKLEISNEEAAVSNDTNLVARSEKGFHTVTVNSSADSGKFAHTEVSPLSHGFFNGKAITLARILIKTGRTHQIRSQSAFHGFPLLGDTAYGGTKIDSKRLGQDFFLHAAELHIPADNPIGLPQTIIAPPQKNFSDFIEKFISARYN